MVYGTPDGFRSRGVSTLYNMRTGEPILQWAKSERDAQRQHETLLEAIEAFKDELPKYEREVPPPGSSDDLLTCYPIGDHHLGMLAWDKETDADYDMEIAENLLLNAMTCLVDKAESSTEALIILLGDFFHYDSFEAVTPTSRNQLDSDTRYPKMVRAGIRCVRFMISEALKKHTQVRVIVEIGNHDLSSSIFLMECLNSVYELEPRVTIDTSPKHYHYYRFGKCLIGTHHGHNVKMPQLPLIMAADRPEDWGETVYRYWYTGHIHNSKTQAAVSSQDFTGCSVESFRVLATLDAWAHQRGYRSLRDMKSITLHREFGEVGRTIVNPDMLL